MVRPWVASILADVALWPSGYLDGKSARRTGYCSKEGVELIVNESTERIKKTLKSIPHGRVSSYGAVASAAGLPNGARQVVRILHSSAEAEGLPWHRVLRKDGSIALPVSGGFELQKALLEAEGVVVDSSGKVELERFSWEFRRARPLSHSSKNRS